MAYSRPCSKRDGSLLSQTQSEYFVASLSTGYVPTKWRQVKVMFIPKPGRKSYRVPRGYIPKSLTSFLLMTMERLMGRYLRDEALTQVPLHPKQHAY